MCRVPCAPGSSLLRQASHSLTAGVAQAINTFLITARTCTKALVAHDRQQHPGVWHWLRGHATRLGVEWRMLLLQLLTSWQGWTARA